MKQEVIRLKALMREAGIDPFADDFKQKYWFEAWDGLLKGYYLRR